MGTRIPDERLYSLIQEEDQKALELLFDKYYPNLCRFSCQFSIPKENAEEVVSEVFIKLWNGRKFRTISNLRLFLYTSVKNASLNALKELHKTSAFGSVPLENLSLSTRSIEEELIENEKLSKLWNMIDQLPEMQRKVLILSKIEGFKYKEIAKILDISVYTVQNHMVAAIKQLGNFRPNLKRA